MCIILVLSNCMVAVCSLHPDVCVSLFVCVPLCVCVCVCHALLSTGTILRPPQDRQGLRAH